MRDPKTILPLIIFHSFFTMYRNKEMNLQRLVDINVHKCENISCLRLKLQRKLNYCCSNKKNERQNVISKIDNEYEK